MATKYTNHTKSLYVRSLDVISAEARDLERKEYLDGELAKYETWDDARSNIFMRGLFRNENEWSTSSKPLYQVWRLADRWQDHQIGCELGDQRNCKRGPQLNRADSGTRAITCRDLVASANAMTRAAAGRIIDAQELLLFSFNEFYYLDRFCQ
ncbi:MAG TPA: hypothetical protein VMW72_26580 [Sedimentisphaerales bacterium]|nr:hypothetical protein [Sedimentisphaerales bacterium]